MTKCTTPTATFPRCKGRQITASFDGGEVTSDGGILLLRQLDREMGLTRAIARRLSDDRDPQRCLHRTETLVRQRVFGLALGYEDLNDAVRVSADPTFRLIGSKKNWDRGAALTSRLQSFETGMLAGDENLVGLMAVNRELIAQAEDGDESERVVLDMDYWVALPR